MRILLVPNPVIHEGLPSSYVPLGLLALGTVLQNDGYEVEILDINRISTDTHYREVPEAIIARKPDVVGFSAWCNQYFRLLKFAETIRDQLPASKIIFGGVQATHTDRVTVQSFPQVDLVARGECDHTISQIMKAIHEPDELCEVPGVTFLHRGDVVRTPDQGPVADLDSLPLPDYNLFPPLQPGARIGIEVGRGCPFKCAYCVTNSIGGGSFRQRSVESVLQIVKSIVANYGGRYFRFEHDMLTLNRRWLSDLCDSIKREELDIAWECFSRIDTVDDATLEQMADAGCDFIYFGIESGSQRMQKILNKRLNLKKAYSVVRKACDVGIVPNSGFIVGFPDERKSDVAQTIRLMTELYFAGEPGRSRISLWLLVPFPGSPLYEQYGHTLSLDEHVSNFSVHHSTAFDLDFVKKYPEVFSTMYHFNGEHVGRETFVKIVYLMMNLGRLKYTLFTLLKDHRLGYPQSLLDRIESLSLPQDSIFDDTSWMEALEAVSLFVLDTVNDLGYGDHYIHDLVRFDQATHRLRLDETLDKSMFVEDFSYDIMAFVREVNSNCYRTLPEGIRKRSCSLVLIRKDEEAVDCVELPKLFRSGNAPLCLGGIRPDAAVHRGSLTFDEARLRGDNKEPPAAYVIAKDGGPVG